MENLPLMSVIAPILACSTLTFTPINGSCFSSVIFPFTIIAFWAKSEKGDIKIRKNENVTMT
jgi:hypothetical protein